MRWYICMTMVAMLVVNCGDGNSLEGSISEHVSLQFDDVAVKSMDSVLWVDYLEHVDFTEPDVVCKIVVDTEGANLRSGAAVSGIDFLERVTLRRATQDGREFPLTTRGEVIFDVFSLRQGRQVRGSFFAQFADGRGIRGEFDSTSSRVSLE